MYTVHRSEHNPLLSPNPRHHPWEATGAFNWSVVKVPRGIKAVYRALSATHHIDGFPNNSSVIGLAEGKDEHHLSNRRAFIVPEEPWEKYGCEDPRITKLGKEYYIFYTALSKFPFEASGIKVAVAKTKDFKKIERHLVTPFNAKAMVLFPEKINGKFVTMLSVNTDHPPAKFGIAEFEHEEEIWSEDFWNRWYPDLDEHSIDPRRSQFDHVEIGAAPIKTKEGWLLVYSHIQNYFGGGPKVFGIEALLLDLNDPHRIIGRTEGPIIVPDEKYEKYGYVNDVVFPSGALKERDTLHIYYGAADTVGAKASVNIENLLSAMHPDVKKRIVVRHGEGPLMSPRPENAFEAKAVFNAAAIDLGGKIHLLYRAQAEDGTSTIGYASSKDGYLFDERLNEPIYVPRESFEGKNVPNGNSGCEDPRLTLINDRIYMCYTAYNGTDLPQVAITSIAVDDFLKKNWNWEKAKIISPPGVDDKDAFIFPEKIKGSYFLFHRIGTDICADPLPNLQFEERIKSVNPIIAPRALMWDSARIGISSVPFKTKKGWILLYHGISMFHHTYRVGAILLDSKDPRNVVFRTTAPILQPEMAFEKEGLVPNVVFPCAAILRDNTVFIYYGAADKTIGLATIKLSNLEQMFEY